MSVVRLISLRQLVMALTYSAVYPISNFVGGGAATVGFVVTAPFLPLSRFGGMAFASWFGTMKAYLPGAFVAVVAQVLALIAISSLVRQWRKNR
jgi:hypothetical protein